MKTKTDIERIFKQYHEKMYHLARYIIYDDDNSRHLRLYFNRNKKEDLLHNIKLLNGFSRINITCTDNTITVE